MVPPETAALPAELQIALSYSPLEIRPALQAALMLDQRLSRLMAQSNEPMLGQMRLAWWRDMLGKPVAERPQGDVVLDALGQHWEGREASLITLVDGWEYLLAPPPLPEQAALHFADGRAAPFLALTKQADNRNVISAARLWALVDAAVHIGNKTERHMLTQLARQDAGTQRLARDMRGLAVLRALSLRSLKHDLAPLMQGRGASLTALRAGLLGK